ncbi:MAG: TIM barrel protein [Rhizobiaceae bacterium]
MKTSIATVSISGSLSEKLTAIAAAGFDAIEIFENDFLAFDGPPSDVAKMVRDHGLEISLFQPFRDFEGMPGKHRAQAFERAERKFDLMQELGTDLILVCSSVSPLALGGIDRAVDDFAELGERAAKKGIRVGYEALAWGKHVDDHRDAWEIVRRADHPNIGLIVDSFHTLARQIDPDTIRSIPGDKIFFVQLADAPLIDMDLLHLSRHYRNMPGEGDLDVTAFMRAVAATGYDGVLSLEVFNDQFRGGSPSSISIDGHRSLLALMDQVKREEPEIAIDVPAMPDRVDVSGIEFIEFATTKNEAEQLSKVLTTLEFVQAGQHISKDASLWRQGDINIVINTDTNGFAHTSYINHGTGVCDIGLKVGDAVAAVERALALGAAPFNQSVGSKELNIPAIRGVGGSVIHFLDAKTELTNVWDIEFSTSDAREETGNLVSIDHIAQTMRHEEMLTWALFYTSIFKTQKPPIVDVVDPAGLIRSQVVENDEGSFRLTLNGAENHRTFAGNFITEVFGSAVQHIAFACHDIFATAKLLRDNQFIPLNISPNYYGDLDARYQLDENLMSKLREFHILYDRDDDGEFFQFYSPNYGEGFFFEIVERRGNYQGYGATNAQFRIAAQKRNMRAKGMPKR